MDPVDIEAGRAAVQAGDLDGHYDQAGERQTAFVDALANIMLAARADGVDFWGALEDASLHYDAEVAAPDEEEVPNGAR